MKIKEQNMSDSAGKVAGYAVTAVQNFTAILDHFRQYTINTSRLITLCTSVWLAKACILLLLLPVGKRAQSLSGTSVRAADASCLNAPVTSDELHDCIKRLKRNKSAGIDGILSEMVKDGGEVLHSCLLVIFNLMLVSHFPKQLSVGLITAVYKSGDKTIYTTHILFGKLCALQIQQRTSINECI